MKAILAEKIEKPLLREALQQFKLKLGEETKELDVKIKKLDITSGDWILIEYNGEDNEIFTELLRRDHGFIPIEVAKIKHDAIRARPILPRRYLSSREKDLGFLIFLICFESNKRNFLNNSII